MARRRALAGAVVVLTGASSGIGRAAALEFARRGANVVLAARDETALTEVAADCERLGASQALAVPTDVTDTAAVQELAEAAYSAAKFGLVGFSEALHGELGRWPGIHVCDVYPSFIDTPGMRDGANYTGRAVRPLPPVYDARWVARAIVAAAEKPRRSIRIGAPASLLRVAHALTPGYSRLSARFIEAALSRAKPAPVSSGNLFTPPPGGRHIDGGWRRSSAHRRRAVSGAVIMAAGLFLASRWAASGQLKK